MSPYDARLVISYTCIHEHTHDIRTICPGAMYISVNMTFGLFVQEGALKLTQYMYTVCMHGSRVCEIDRRTMVSWIYIVLAWPSISTWCNTPRRTESGSEDCSLSSSLGTVIDGVPPRRSRSSILTIHAHDNSERHSPWTLHAWAADASASAVMPGLPVVALFMSASAVAVLNPLVPMALHDMTTSTGLLRLAPDDKHDRLLHRTRSTAARATAAAAANTRADRSAHIDAYPDKPDRDAYATAAAAQLGSTISGLTFQASRPLLVGSFIPLEPCTMCTSSCP